VIAAALRRRARGVLWLAWLILLLLPSAIGFIARDPWALYASAGFFLAVWLAVGSRWFFVVTYPLALLGVLAFAADSLRGVHLLDLLLLQGRIDWREAYFALQPYFAAIGGAVLGLAAGAIAGFHRPVPSPSPRARVGGLTLLVGGMAVMGAASPGTVVRAWPINVASVEAASALGRQDWIAMAVPWAPVSPRLSRASWSASRRRDVPAAKRETYILVIGESVRADHLAACGGPSALSMNRDVIVYCDVTSGASSTYLSVPLLVSREMPGAPERVSTDATVLRAFGEAGFRTYWIAEEEESVAWPDADVMRFITPRSTSRADLLPLVESALDDPPAKKALVIHTYDAHFPYCHRFDPRTAPIPVVCGALGSSPRRATLGNWVAAYDDAIAEALGFLDALIERLDASGEEVFLAYTPDHGENLLDDERGLYFHALSAPTRFDTRVPMIFWASPAWRRTHPAEMRALEAHRGVAAMHADLVPTLLGAAGIAYFEPRKEVVDLTRAAPRRRIRWVARRLGQAVDGDRLR
jgi:hypothetical protein